jgi:hypothetical protein
MIILALPLLSMRTPAVAISWMGVWCHWSGGTCTTAAGNIT